MSSWNDWLAIKRPWSKVLLVGATFLQSNAICKMAVCEKGVVCGGVLFKLGSILHKTSQRVGIYVGDVSLKGRM
eukprot:5405297-Amphidinium_carterae.1